MDSPRYLFVNNTPLSQGSATNETKDRKLINRHTQLHGLASRNFGKPNQGGKKLSSVDPNLRTGPSRRRKSQDVKREFQAADLHNPGLQTEGGSGVISPKLSDKQRPQAQQEAHTLLERILFTVKVMSNEQKSQNLDPSPFQGLLLSLDAHICQYLRKYPFSTFEKTLMPGGTSESHSERLFLGTVVSVLEGSLDDDLLAYALLANMSTILSEHCEKNKSISQFNSNYYGYQATAALRRRLSSEAPPDTTLVLSLWHMISAEMNQGNFEAATIHLKGAVAICDLLCINDPNYVAPFQICDCLLATGIFEQHPEVSYFTVRPDSAYCTDNYFHSLSLIHSTPSRSVPSKFTSGKHTNLLCPDLRKVVEDLVNYNASAAERNHSKEDWKNSIKDGHWSHLSWRFLTSRESKHVSFALARALGMWIYLMLYTLSDIKIAQPVSFSLQKLLSTTSMEEWSDHEDVLIWILTVGAMVPMGTRAEQMWYARKLVTLLDDSDSVKEHDFTKKRDIVEFSKNYLWIDDLQRSMLEPLVAMIKSIRLEKNLLKPYREARFFSSYTGEASGKGKWHRLSNGS
ncbi:hypothetical protein LTR84_005580 [Exophiala bonariae]|uniref:Transcription factor domain-containing protein n=1 Tax=Exophiala bonariae TaxID=1690606 RepID=A0AAV9N4Z8_9EURO|nr:hypothetical protein LTR84_005580 [Exophiala bonariae]